MSQLFAMMEQHGKDPQPKKKAKAAAKDSQKAPVTVEKLMEAVTLMSLQNMDMTRALDARHKRKWMMPGDHPLAKILAQAVTKYKEAAPAKQSQGHPWGGMWRTLNIALLGYGEEHWEELKPGIDHFYPGCPITKEMLAELIKKLLESERMELAERMSEMTSFRITEEKKGLLQIVPYFDTLPPPFPPVEGKYLVNVLLLSLNEFRLYGKAPKGKQQRVVESMFKQAKQQ